jgi:hypothetical protein
VGSIIEGVGAEVSVVFRWVGVVVEDRLVKLTTIHLYHLTTLTFALNLVPFTFPSTTIGIATIGVTDATIINTIAGRLNNARVGIVTRMQVVNVRASIMGSMGK